MKCNFCEGQSKDYLIINHGKILKCDKCKIAFTYPAPVLPEYELLDFHSCHTLEKFVANNNIESLHPQWQALINKQVEILSTYLNKGSNLLEIGCGEGILLNELKKSGFNVLGIDPSMGAVKRAIQKNINVREGYFDENSFDEKFDAIILSHVLEHIEDPEKFILTVKKNIKPEGYLFLTQTNYGGLIPKLQKRNWYAWVPEQHFWHFSVQGLIFWLKSLGFKKEYISYISLVHQSSIKFKVINILNKVLKTNADQFCIIFKLEE